MATRRLSGIIFFIGQDSRDRSAIECSLCFKVVFFGKNLQFLMLMNESLKFYDRIRCILFVISGFLLISPNPTYSASRIFV